MIRLYIVFFVLFAVSYFGIPAVRKLTGKAKWDLTKTLVYSIICALLTVVAMMAIVVLF
jgi:hypothetical protein